MKRQYWYYSSPVDKDGPGTAKKTKHICNRNNHNYAMDTELYAIYTEEIGDYKRLISLLNSSLTGTTGNPREFLSLFMQS